MRNRVTGLAATRTHATSSWASDEHPRGRLWGLFAGVFLLLAVIIARVAYLQIGLTDAYQQEFSRIAESGATIPSRDARMVSADGQVLAHDGVHSQEPGDYT